LKSFFVVIALMVITAVMVVTNPSRNCFDKYFASKFSRESDGLLEAVAANIFVSRSLNNCEYRDLFFLSLAKVPTENGELTYIGLFNRWMQVPF
jgi:hypothetical protein